MPRKIKFTAPLVALSLLAAACAGSEAEPVAVEGEGANDAQEQDGGDGAEGPADYDVGVTEEACPDAVNEDNGCIYLGVLSDLTDGPFAPLGTQFTEVTRLFWERVNEEGGIGGFDIDATTYVRDNKYNPQTSAERFREIEPNILAVAHSLGTPTTLAIVEEMQEKDVVGVPSTAWSGWPFHDNMLMTGYTYCFEAMNGLDYVASEHGQPDRVMAVGFPGDFGGDSAAGVERWAAANDVAFDGSRHRVETLPNAQAGNQNAVIETIMREQPDVVMLAVGAAEMADIVGNTVAQGFEGRFVGSIPSWSPAVLDSPAGDAILERYVGMTYFGPWGSDTPAHEAMQAAVGEGEVPPSDFYVLGWVWQYPLKSALEAAADNGDLTRAGLRAVVDGLQVDHEGALPDKSFGDPDGTVFRQALVTQPNVDAPLGSVAVGDFREGPTARDFEFTEPCSSVG